MNAISARSQIGQRTISSLNTPYCRYQTALKRRTRFYREDWAKLNNYVFYTDSSKFLFAKPVSVTVVPRVAAPFIFCEPDIEWNFCRIFPNIHVHGVLPVNTGSV